MHISRLAPQRAEQVHRKLVAIHAGRLAPRRAASDHMKVCWCTLGNFEHKFVEIEDILHTEDLDIGNFRLC